MAEQTKQRARLDPWFTMDNSNVLYGIVWGHPRIEDGTDVHTSRVVKLDEENKVCETLNTIYELGERRIY